MQLTLSFIYIFPYSKRNKEIKKASKLKEMASLCKITSGKTSFDRFIKGVIHKLRYRMEGVKDFVTYSYFYFEGDRDGEVESC